MYLDVHHHVIPSELLALARRDPRMGFSVTDGIWQGRHHTPFPLHASFYDPEAKLAGLTAHGLGGAVISPPPPAFCYHLDPGLAAEACRVANEGMARFCEHAPDRLYWLANLPMQAPAAAAEVYQEAIAAGAVGAATGTSISGRRLDEPGFATFWEAADGIGKPVLIHPAYNCAHPALEQWYLQNVIGNPLETTITVERLVCAGVLDRYPRLRLVLMHGGGFLPYQAGRLVHARRVRPELVGTPVSAWDYFTRLYFDTITHDAQALRYLVARVGLGQVVLGTDLPFDMALADPVAALAEALTADQAEAVAVANPRRLFGLE